MKAHSVIFAIMLCYSLLVFPCWGKQKVAQSSSRRFLGFPSLEFSYVDVNNSKKTITLHRNVLVLNLLDQLQETDISDDLEPVKKRSIEKFRHALQLLYGKKVTRNTVRAVKLLHELADVEKPYTPKRWKKSELRYHLAAKYILSLCYQCGAGVPKDLEKGMLLLQEACFYDQLAYDENGFGWNNKLDSVVYPLAVLEMSLRFLGGIDIAPNFEKGLLLLEWTEEQGNSVAQEIKIQITKVAKVPRKFRRYKSPVALVGALEGVSASDISKMLASEKSNQNNEEPILPNGKFRLTSPPPPRPAPNPQVQRVMTKLIEYQKKYNDKITNICDRTCNRYNNLENEFEGLIAAVGHFADFRCITEEQVAYIRNLQTIDLSGCPDDFKFVFTFYIQLLTNMATVVAGVSHPEFNDEEDVLAGFIGGVLVVGLVGDSVQRDLVNIREALFELADEKYGVYFDYSEEAFFK